MFCPAPSPSPIPSVIPCTVTLEIGVAGQFGQNGLGGEACPEIITEAAVRLIPGVSGEPACPEPPVTVTPFGAPPNQSLDRQCAGRWIRDGYPVDVMF